MTESAGTAWTNEELRAALDGYLYLLQLEISSIPFSPTQHSEVLLNGPLSKRSEASIRYRMRNISFLVEERELPYLKAFSPAPQVGRNVKAHLLDMLDQRKDSVDIIIRLRTQKQAKPSLEDLHTSLEKVQNQLDSFPQKTTIGIGHNNPPLEFHLIKEIPKLSASISKIENEIVREKPNTSYIAKLSEKLIEFGLKLVVWSSQRITDFVKAGVIASGTMWGLSHASLSQNILEAIRSIYQVLF